jgi:hypothetical protein
MKKQRHLKSFYLLAGDCINAHPAAIVIKLTRRSLTSAQKTRNIKILNIGKRSMNSYCYHLRV